MTARRFLHRQFPVPPALQPYVECFDTFEEVPPGRPITTVAGEICHETLPGDDRLVESVIPGGRLMLSFNLGDPFTLARESRTETRREPSHVVGADTGRMRMVTGGHVELLGVMLRPGCGAAFLGMPADEVAGRFVGLGELWGRDGRQLDDQLRDSSSPLERIACIADELLRRLGRHGLPDLRFASLADLIARHGGSIRIEALSDASGLTRQHLTRRFRELVGVTPKQFCRLERFDQVFRAAYRRPRVDWAQVALDCGYYDQAHLIAEFKEFTGMTPTEFFQPLPRAAGS